MIVFAVVVLFVVIIVVVSVDTVGVRGRQKLWTEIFWLNVTFTSVPPHCAVFKQAQRQCYVIREYMGYTGCPTRKVNILESHSIGHSKQKSVYVHVSYSERFPR
jgi:hypothetical protein